MIKARRNANRIFSIKDATGKVHTDIEGIANSFINFYKNLLGECKEGRQHVCSNLVRRGPIVQQEQREKLKAQFTEKEVKAALWSIVGDKSTGPDGYGSQLFKDCWPVVKHDLIGSAMEFFEMTKMLKIINNTTITLVPKNNHADEV